MNERPIAEYISAHPVFTAGVVVGLVVALIIAIVPAVYRDHTHTIRRAI